MKQWNLSTTTLPEKIKLENHKANIQTLDCRNPKSTILIKMFYSSCCTEFCCQSQIKLHEEGQIMGTIYQCILMRKLKQYINK